MSECYSGPEPRPLVDPGDGVPLMPASPDWIPDFFMCTHIFPNNGCLWPTIDSFPKGNP